MEAAGKKIERLGLGGTTMDVIAGIGAVVLAILGLVGLAPAILVAVSTIALGVALMAESATFTAEYSALAEMSESGAGGRAELSSGLGVEGMAGGASLVLGILALVGVHPAILLPSASIVLGAGVMFGSGVHDRVRALRVEGASTVGDIATREAVATATGAQVLVGIGAIVLGILALVGFAPLTLTLVAVLSIGTSILLSGAAVGGRLFAMLRRT